MNINKFSSTPLYVQVKEWIRDQIYRNDLKSGDRIPSENEIMKVLSVSRGTVRKAVDLLIKESVLEQIQGKGTYVKKENISYQLGYGLQSFAESLEMQNVNFVTEVITKRIEKSNEYISSKLQIPANSDIFYMERVRSVNGEKIMFIENRINLALFPQVMDIDFNKYSLFSELERITHQKIKYSECRYSARIVGKERAQMLDISETSPVLHLEQTVYLDNDLAVEFGNVWLKSNVNYLGTTLRRT